MAIRTLGSILLLAATSSAQLMLFTDHTLFANFSKDLELSVNQPIKHPDLAVWPTEAWESWAVFAYNSVVAANATRGVHKHRLYYDCIEGKGEPPGRRADTAKGDTDSGSLSHRRICLAESTDGLTWTKPSLGIYARNGSTANNILVEDSGNSVFWDPSAAPDARWKMICSHSVYASPDGLHWTRLPFATVAADDTKPTAYWDPRAQAYVVVVRRDLPPPPGKSGDVMRYIGRCETANISDWQSEIPKGASGCDVTFGVDAEDPDHVDIYTNAWTPYPSIDNPAVHLFFPSYYAHFDSYSGAALSGEPGARPPYGFGNDGLLDVRLVVSRDGKSLDYVPARNGRAPYVPLGLNECGPRASAPGVAGGWCSPFTGVEARTSPDTSAMYMASGWVPSADGTEVYLFGSAQPFTHGDDGQKHSPSRFCRTLFFRPNALHCTATARMLILAQCSAVS